jgi:ribosome recycling factor
MESLINETRQKMQKAVEHLLEELLSIRSGRATPSLIESTKVNVYNSSMPLRDLASINAPEPRLLIVQPWDQNNVDPIVKALRENGMGFNPVAEGGVIRVAVPALSEERRGSLIKLVGEKSEMTRVAIRSARRDAIDEIDKNEKAGKLSKDDAKRYNESVQKVTDEFIEQIDKVVKKKEAELKEI